MVMHTTSVHSCTHTHTHTHTTSVHSCTHTHTHTTSVHSYTHTHTHTTCKLTCTGENVGKICVIKPTCCAKYVCVFVGDCIHQKTQITLSIVNKVLNALSLLKDTHVNASNCRNTRNHFVTFKRSIDTN